MINDLGNKLPDCGYCNQQESARSIAYGKFICPDCIIKLNKRINEKEKKEREDFERCLNGSCQMS